MYAEALVSKRGIVSSVLSPPPVFAVIHAIQTASPPVACSSLKVKEGNHAKHVFSSSLPCHKTLREGRLVSAASQKVPARAPGDTECYHSFDRQKERRNACEEVEENT